MVTAPKTDKPKVTAPKVYRLKPGNITFDRHGAKRFGGTGGDDIELTDEGAAHLKAAGIIE